MKVFIKLASVHDDQIINGPNFLLSFKIIFEPASGSTNKAKLQN